MLIKAFANFILLTIFAPIQIVLGVVIPSLSFGSWLRSMLSNLTVFVMAGGMFLLAFIFLIQSTTIAIADIVGSNAAGTIVNLFFGNFAGNAFGILSGQVEAGWPPLLNILPNASIPFLFMAISLVIFLAIPKAADIIKGMIEGKPFAFGTAIGEAVAPIGAFYNSAPVKAYREATGREGGATIADVSGELAGAKGYTGIKKRFEDIAGSLRR